jgi:predicted nucleic acid-binding protein
MRAETLLLAYLDASALAKRYAPEPGTVLMNTLFARLPPDRMALLTVGAVEVMSVFVRRRNSRRLSGRAYLQAVTEFDREILSPAWPFKIPVDLSLVISAVSLVGRHSINGTDALVLRSALELATPLRQGGDDLFLVASDLRLLRAAQTEGLATFDPERQTAGELESLLGP